LKAAKAALNNKVETVALDVNDEAAVRNFFEEKESIDHIFITAGNPAHAPRLEIDTRLLGSQWTPGSWERFTPSSMERRKSGEVVP
jgi:NAD(P)-dependent dehydrogenase (short-subunit alcohol dehydrogenase family)